MTIIKAEVEEDDELLALVWDVLATVDSDNCSREEALAAIDEACTLMNAHDAERFPWDEEDEGRRG